jgi:hypothetical protein
MTGIELTAPRLLEPTDAALFTSATVTFRWTPVTYATSYTLVVTSGSTQVFRGVSTTTSFSPSSTVLAAGTYSWAVSAAAGSTTGPMSLTSRFTVKLPMSPADIVKVATPSIVELAVEYADGGNGIAGAFFVDSSGIVVTTYEVIKGAVAGSLFLADDTELTSLRVLGYDPALDVAILKVPTAKPLPALSLTTASTAQINQDVVMVSPIFAQATQFTVAGIVNALTKNGFTVRGAAEKAVDGSPVFDQFGDVIGMVTTDIQPATGAFPAVSATSIRGVARTGDWTIREVTEREGTGLQALDSPTPAQPAGEAIVGSLTPDFRWNTVAGATRYHFWVGEGRNATGEGIITAFIDYTDLRILPGMLKPGTTYTWAIRAGNDNGWGPWSPDRMFTTSSSIVQPMAPVVLEPIEGVVVKAAEPVLLWSAVTGASQYYVRITLPNNDIVFETSTANTSVVVPEGTLTSGTAYLWTVRVENSSGISSLWVAPYLKFSSAIPTGIGVPSLLSPAPKAILSALNPTFTWQAVPGATRYNLRILNDAGTTIVYEVIALGSSFTVPAGKLQPGIPYMWVVIAGNATNWSQTGSTWNWSLNRPFTINLTATIDIVPPVLLAPADGTTLTTLTATLQWSSVQGATWYRVYLGKGTSESDLVQVVNRVVDPKAGDTQQYALSIGVLEAGSTYYWRVLAGAGEDMATPEFMHFTTAP